MPRPSNEASVVLADLTSRLAKLVETARREGREEAMAEIRHLVAGGDNGGFPKPMKRGGKKAKAPKPAAKPRSGKKRKNPWAGLSDADRLARVNAIRVGRGLAPKSSL